MTHLPFTLAAYFFNALSVLSNKFLLKQAIPNPLLYIFYISLFSLVILLLTPFTAFPGLIAFSLASVSTILWTLAAYLMFSALKSAPVSRVVPIIGTLIPLILLIFAAQTNVITSVQMLAVGLAIAGMAVITLPDWQGKHTGREIILEISSATCFALAYLILKEAYRGGDFFSVLVWSRPVLVPAIGLVFLLPSLRGKIFGAGRLKINFLSFQGLIFLGGQVSGAASELLILFSISLANPALVNSLQGTQYIFLFIFALLLSKKYPAVFEEKYSPVILISKIIGIGLLGAGLYLLAFTNG